MENFKTLQKRASKIERDWETEKYRTLSRRLGSGLVDSAILLVPVILVILLLKYFSIPGKYLVVVTLSQLFSITFNIFFVGLKGTTPGKSLFGMKISLVHEESGTIGFKNATLRELLNSTSLFLYLAMVVTYSIQGRLSASDGIMKNSFHDLLWNIVTIVGLIIGWSEIVTALFNKKRRAFHDIIAGTVVLKSELKNKVLAGLLVIVSLGIYYVYFQAYNLLKS